MSSTSKSKSTWIWPLIIIFLAVAYYFYTSSGGENPPQNPTEEVLGNTTSVPTEISGVLPQGGYFEIYFTIPLDPNDKSVEQALISKIDASKTSISMAVFEFDIEEVAEAILRAEKRGVEVRVVYDNEYSDPDPQMGMLKAAGIQTIPDNRTALMHNKFFVFDDACVWTGSFNISDNASKKNNENAIYFCSPEAAENYSVEFEEMFAGEFGPTSTANTPHPAFEINGFTVENCFASEDNCMEKVINAVEKANTSVHFMAFSFTDDDLANAMITNANRGVVIEGIFESRGANTEYSECNTLLKQGFDIRLDGNPYTFHHKVIIVDEQFVIFGSFNFSASADKNNDENLLIWYDPQLAQLFEQQYQIMKSQAVIPQGLSCTK